MHFFPNQQFLVFFFKILTGFWPLNYSHFFEKIITLNRILEQNFCRFAANYPAPSNLINFASPNTSDIVFASLWHICYQKIQTFLICILWNGSSLDTRNSLPSLKLFSAVFTKETCFDCVVTKVNNKHKVRNFQIITPI